MRESLDEPVSVVTLYNAKLQRFQPYRLTWQNQDYILGKVDYHHKTKNGNKLIHHFSLCDQKETMYFKLALDTETLHWVIEEYMSASEATVVCQTVS